MKTIRLYQILIPAIILTMVVFCGQQEQIEPAENLTPPKLGIDRLNESPRHQEWIDLETASGNSIRAFIVFPEVSEPSVSVVLIHEIYGLSDWIRGMADQFAEKGYVAIVPDLLTGKGPDGGGTASFASRDDVVRAIRGLSDEEVVEGLAATTDYVMNLTSTTDKIAVAGFCWGGSKTWVYGNTDKPADLLLPFYGTGPTNEDGVANVTSPVYGFYGGNDNRVTSTVEATEAAINAAGKSFEAVVYPGAGHGFMRSGEADDAARENREARNRAWLRVLELLKALSQ